MEKPIRPTKPRLRKFPEPRPILNDYYMAYTDYTQNPPSNVLHLTEDPWEPYFVSENGDENENDENDVESDDREYHSSLPLEEITRLSALKGFDPKYLFLEVVGDYLVFRYNAPITSEVLSQLQQEHQRAVAAEALRFQEAMAAYPAALESYKRQLAVYEIWKAERRLEKLRNQKLS